MTILKYIGVNLVRTLFMIVLFVTFYKYSMELIQYSFTFILQIFRM